MKKAKPSIKKSQQKKVNHIFHYTRDFSTLLKILKNDFLPSYCEETISDISYLIPMISFCNISIKDVELYMHYGKYGVGLTVDWAIKNKISPVIYFHEKSPFNDLHSQINKLLINHVVEEAFTEGVKQAEKKIAEGQYENFQPVIDQARVLTLLSQINQITVPTLQFFKCWKTLYKNQEIITYLEREWRFVPVLGEEKRLITSTNPEFSDYKNKNLKPKPHLPKYPLRITAITDLRYFIVRTDKERKSIIQHLQKKFGADPLREAIFEGKLFILKEEQIRNDF